MSTRVMRCSKCDSELAFDRLAPFGEGQHTYAVAWSCPQGHGLSLDICPVGPLVPGKELCLNCGGSYGAGDGHLCDLCGLARPDCLASLGLDGLPEDDPVASANVSFSHGLFRRGMAVINRALLLDVELFEAWLLKARLLHSLGYGPAVVEMLDGALAASVDTGVRISLLEERSFQCAESGRGEEALRSADAAMSLGSTSIRTHYLRGRALAQHGRLTEARSELKLVLELDPANADALRGLGMIDTAIPPPLSKRWWKFWK